MSLKHVGRLKKNQRKVIVAYRTVPGEPENCIVVTTENLLAEEHDSLMKAVESDSGQVAYEFAEAMMRNTLPDGRNMLAALHTTGKMIKVPTSDVEMTPDRNTVIQLDDLNRMIAENKGVSVEDLSIKDTSKSNKPKDKQVVLEEFDLSKQSPVSQVQDSVITDEQLAAKYRSDADRLFKEAKRLRDQAEELVPSKRTTRKVKDVQE